MIRCRYHRKHLQHKNELQDIFEFGNRNTVQFFGNTKPIQERFVKLRVNHIVIGMVKLPFKFYFNWHLF